MGTNYYARIIPSKARKSKLKQAIDEDRFDLIKELYNEMYSESNKYEEGSVIHLGKRSAGWKFLFNPNYERYYKLTKKSLMEFLSRPDIIIYSEYCDINNNKYSNDPDKNNSLWTPQQFMDMATHWGYDNNAWDGESYEKWELDKNPNYQGYERYGDRCNEKIWKEKGYNPSYYNFYSDGLRWSTCCEFS